MRIEGVEVIALKPGRGTIEKDLTSWHDGEWLEFYVTGNTGPVRIGFSPTRTGNMSPGEFDKYYDPKNASEGYFLISPDDLSAVAEGATLYYSLWEVIDERVYVRAEGSMFKKPSIQVPPISIVFVVGIYEPGVYE